MAASRAAREVVPCFILDDTILNRFEGHGYRKAFVFDSLRDLARQVKDQGGVLNIVHERPEVAVERMIVKAGIDSVFVNRDYTPFSARRDRTIEALCKRLGISFHRLPDTLLNEPEAVRKADGSPYVVFTPYFRSANQRAVPAPDSAIPANFCKQGFIHDEVPECEITSPVAAGRTGAQGILKLISSLKDYAHTRDYPALEGTSRLSCHLRFGTVSPREVWHATANALGSNHPMLRQLYWRDFFTQIAFHYPHVFGHAFRRQYDRLTWNKDDDLLQAWCEGRTGFPLVDAGMRELVATGYMHNRVRMVAASFLVKNLHIDWRIGEAFFARHLIDYDPAVNNGNWQWVASTGCDAQPYFRVFNPFRQQLKFDPDALYIKRWVSELARWSERDIHGLDRRPEGYFPPIVDLKASAEEIKARFKSLG